MELRVQELHLLEPVIDIDTELLLDSSHLSSEVSAVTEKPVMLTPVYPTVIQMNHLMDQDIPKECLVPLYAGSYPYSVLRLAFSVDMVTIGTKKACGLWE